MAGIQGGVKIAGFISPYDSEDQYPVTDPLYAIGGIREVAAAADRDAIPPLRRRMGMLVTTQSDLITWQLQSDLVTWKPFASATPSSPTLFEIAISLTGGVYQDELVGSYIATQPYHLSKYLTFSKGKCYGEQLVNLILLIQKNQTVIGEVRIIDSAVTFSLNTDADFLAGDEIAFVSDRFATFKALTFTIHAERPV